MDHFTEAWNYYFQKFPNAAANWGHQNGRMPRYIDIPEWYDAHPEAARPAPAGSTEAGDASL